MTQAPVKRLYTFDEYLNYDDRTDKHYELVNGELVEMPPPWDQHEAIIGLLFVSFYLEIQCLGLDWQVRQSGTGVRTTKEKSRLPDVFVMTGEQRRSIKGKSAVLELPPLLTVEVVSPESVKRDYEEKPLEYAHMGISEYWIVDPLEAKVSVLLPGYESYNTTEFRGTERIISHTFPELTLTAEQVLSA